jgi:hypothetical protein
MKSAHFGLLVCLGICCGSLAAAASALPDVADAFMAADGDSVESETTLHLPAFGRTTKATVRGFFSPNKGSAPETIKMQATVRVGESTRSVPVELEKTEKGFSFGIHLRGDEHKVPKYSKVEATIHLTSPAKGTFGQIEISRED